VTTKQEALEALDAMFRENEVPMSDRNGVLHDRLRQFIESAGADSERYRFLRQHFDDIWWSVEGDEVHRVKALGVTGESAPRLDAAIDAALAARSPQPGDGA